MIAVRPKPHQMQLYTLSDFGQACKDKGGDKDDGDVLKEDEGRDVGQGVGKVEMTE